MSEHYHQWRHVEARVAELEQIINKQLVCYICKGTPLTGHAGICSRIGFGPAQSYEAIEQRKKMDDLELQLTEAKSSHEKTAKQLADSNALEGFLEKKVAELERIIKDHGICLDTSGLRGQYDGHRE